MSVPNESQFCADFFNANAHKYDLTTSEGCGQYNEALVVALRIKDTKWGLLKKNPGQTQYNGHGIDIIIYALPFEGDTKLRSIDILGDAESINAHPIWLPDSVARYTIADWLATPNGNPVPVNMVPWVAYDENSFQKLKATLAYDYGRRPQGADFDVTVWSARVFHSAYMGPDKKPLGLDAAIKRHRPEWCAALGIPVDSNWM